MIAIGMDNSEKIDIIREHLCEHEEIKKLIVFSPERFALPDKELEALGIEYEQRTWDDIILYKHFYRLLEEIDDTRLIVVNECLRTQNRSDLTYNCLHHYLNQTKHRIVFEWFPFIEDETDFMILLDKDAPGRYKGRGFDAKFIDEATLRISPYMPKLNVVRVPVDQKAIAAYQKEKEKQFSNLNQSDPDVIPRRLHLWCGRYKTSAITNDGLYAARNSRFGRENVFTYKDAYIYGNYSLLDIAHRRLDMNDFMKRCTPVEMTFLSTGLPVDEYYYEWMQDWLKRLEAFYAIAGVCIKIR